eukprot:Awhi_evm1s8086
MHEAGHMFGLPHIFTKTTMKNGIMSRGSGFYSWAENVKDIPVKFLDATVIDESKHHNDSCGR